MIPLLLAAATSRKAVPEAVMDVTAVADAVAAAAVAAAAAADAAPVVDCFSGPILQTAARVLVNCPKARGLVSSCQDPLMHHCQQRRLNGA